MQECERMKRSFMKGWNAWNIRSVLSHAHLPEGFAIHLCLKDNGKSAHLKEADIGNKSPYVRVLRTRNFMAFTHTTGPTRTFA